MTSRNLASFCSVGIGLIVVIIIWLTFPHHQYLPRGIFLPSTQQVLPPIPVSQVEIIKSEPLFYKKLGNINIEHHIGLSDQAEEKLLFAYAKTIAAQYGANGIIIKTFIRTQPKGSEAALAAFILYADAISTTQG